MLFLIRKIFLNNRKNPPNLLSTIIETKDILILRGTTLLHVSMLSSTLHTDTFHHSVLYVYLYNGRTRPGLLS